MGGQIEYFDYAGQSPWTGTGTRIYTTSLISNNYLVLTMQVETDFISITDKGPAELGCVRCVKD